MALYGPNAGFVPFTGFSPTLGVSDAVVPVTSGNVQMNGMTQQDGAIARNLFHGTNRVVRRLLIALIGSAAGGNATENRARVQANQSTFAPTDNGGLVPIETVALINRNTTAADDTNLTALISRTPVPTYAVDVSGIGSGQQAVGF
jgi:hypothetical protein